MLDKRFGAMPHRSTRRLGFLMALSAEKPSYSTLIVMPTPANIFTTAAISERC
jgi:hypothetical protein